MQVQKNQLENWKHPDTLYNVTAKYKYVSWIVYKLQHQLFKLSFYDKYNLIFT